MDQLKRLIYWNIREKNSLIVAQIGRWWVCSSQYATDTASQVAGCFLATHPASHSLDCSRYVHVWYLVSEDETLGDGTALTCIADQVTHLLNLCLRSTYFVYRGEHYQQQDGAAMSSPVSPVVANIYMEMFEDLALRTTARLRMWRRYRRYLLCDGQTTHTVIPRPSEQSASHNPVHCGVGEGWETPLLRHVADKEGRWQSQHRNTCRKTTHTDRYLQYTHVKLGVASFLFHRARTIASAEHMERESIWQMSLEQTDILNTSLNPQ